MTTEYITRPDYEKLFNGCVGYWDFNGDAKDCINGNDGTVTGATLTTNRFGMQNRAYSFNGTSDYIQIPDSTALQVSGWFGIWLWFYRTSDSGTTETILNKGDSNTDYKIEIDSNDNIVFSFYNSSGTLYYNKHTTTTISTGQWYNLICYFNTSVFTIIINGSRTSGYYNNNPAGQIPRTTSGDLYLGKRGTVYNFNGIISEVLIYEGVKAESSNMPFYYVGKYKPIYPYMRRTCQR